MDGRVLRAVHAQFTADLHPVLTNAVEYGVRELLNTLLLRYSEDFDGVVLAYDNVRVLSHGEAPLHSYFPYARVAASADLVVFAPTPGVPLWGKVNKVGVDFISLLCAGVVNVAIPAASIRRDLQPLRGQLAWGSRKKTDHVIAVGTDVLFVVNKVQQQGQFLHLTGSLESAGTGAYGYADAGVVVAAARRAARDAQAPRNKGKEARKRKPDGADAATPAAGGTQRDAPSEKKAKKRKPEGTVKKEAEGA